MPIKIPTISCGAVTLALGLALSATPAFAGFQWNASNSGATAQAPKADAYAPAPKAASDLPEVISPIVISGDARSAQVAAPSRSSDVPSSSVVLSSAPEPYAPPSAPAALSTAPYPAASSSGDSFSSVGIVRGFANQVPLALALRQLLPTGYSFYIDQDVNMDTLVSYKGGKPWTETINTMLIPVGLVDHVQGTVVTVSRSSTAPASRAPAAPVAEKSPFLPAQSPTSLPAPLPAKTIGQLTVPASQQQVPFADSVPLVGSAPMGGSFAATGEVWTANRGDTLHKVLTSWCRRAGVELQWLAEYDYPLQASANFNSGFEDAVRDLLTGFDSAQPQPVGELHTNPGAGQMVLVVQARGNSYTN